MNVKLEISEPKDNMTQAQSQMIVRCSNVLREHGFTVELQWKGSTDVEIPPTVRNHPLRTTITHY
jgi:hypothetical protein